MEMKLSLSKYEPGPTLFMLRYFYKKGDGGTVYASLWCRKYCSNFDYSSSPNPD